MFKHIRTHTVLINKNVITEDITRAGYRMVKVTTEQVCRLFKTDSVSTLVLVSTLILVSNLVLVSTLVLVVLTSIRCTSFFLTARLFNKPSNVELEW